MNTENIEQIYELSPLQQGMLFHSVLEPQSGLYIEQFGLTLAGPINVVALQNAFANVLKRHAVLRSSFYWKEFDKPLQVVNREVELNFETENWSALSEGEQQAELAAWVKADQERGFELSKAPLMRVRLIQLGENQHQLFWTFHHILIDGWSIQIVLRELFEFYKAECAGAELILEDARAYQDYILWLQDQDLGKAEAYWKHALRGFSVPTTMQVEKQVVATTSQMENQIQKYKLSAGTTAKLQELARQQQVTLNTVLQATWALLLSRYSGEEDVLFGATMSGRTANLNGIEEMVGLFINTLPVRAVVPEAQTFAEWVKDLHTQQFEALKFEHTPLVKLQEWSEVPHGMSLFKTIFVYQNFPMSESEQMLGEAKITDSVFYERSNYPLALEVNPGTELQLLFSFDQQVYDAPIIERMAHHVMTMLESIAANPEQRVVEVPMLTGEERHQLLVEWNRTEADHPTDGTMHQLFEETVARTPDAIAVIHREQSLTYRELNERANRLAHHLIAQGVGPEVLVGLAVEPSFEMVTAILGVLKAGGAYVPLDPNYPQDRLAFMLEDSEVKLIVTLDTLRDRLPEVSAPLVCLDSDGAVIGEQNAENPVTQVGADNLAYIIYTSGSTGKPKGVLITHRPVVNLMYAVTKTFELNPNDRVLQFASISFDITIEELFPTWHSGGAVVLKPELTLASTKDYSRWILDHGITLVNMPTAYWHEWVNDLSRNPDWIPQTLRLVICGGEKASPATLAIWNEMTQGRIQLRNGYGPTETTVTTTVYDPRMHVDKPDLLSRMPIGRPIDNYTLYLVDAHMQLVPVGVAGEILVGGIGLARGYLKRPELTAEKFIANPFSDDPQDRLYRTGDLARYLPDGSVEFLGRVDHQVKIRGFRIELGEIEEVLTQQPAVDEAVVIVREEAGEKFLVAYLVGDSEQLADLTAIRAALSTQLPAFMVPSYYVVMDALPLTLNNKVDRKRLPAPDMSRRLNENFVAPRTQEEETLAAIWADVLRLDQVGVQDNFFALGGHSLLATKVISRLFTEMGVELPLRALFEAPTIEELTKQIENIKQQSQQQAQEPVLAAVSREGRRSSRRSTEPSGKGR